MLCFANRELLVSKFTQGLVRKYCVDGVGGIVSSRLNCLFLGGGFVVCLLVGIVPITLARGLFSRAVLNYLSRKRCQLLQVQLFVRKHNTFRRFLRIMACFSRKSQ